MKKRNREIPKFIKEAEILNAEDFVKVDPENYTKACLAYRETFNLRKIGERVYKVPIKDPIFVRREDGRMEVRYKDGTILLTEPVEPVNYTVSLGRVPGITTEPVECVLVEPARKDEDK